MANKRISELAQIISSDLSDTDLLLLADVSAFESKKLQLSDLTSFILSNGSITGSFNGTASYSLKSLSASYAPSQVSCSYANTSSWAWNAITSSHALDALSASYSFSSSYAVTASYACTSSVQFIFSSAFATLADSASYLIYTPGVINGTASFAISSSWAASIVSASYSQTASHAIYSISSSHALTADTIYTTNVQSSASWASQSLSSSITTLAHTASYLTPNLLVYQDYGVFLATTHSNYISQLDSVRITPYATTSTSSFEAMGTAIAYYTSSINETISLYARNRETGKLYLVDSTPIYFGIDGTGISSGSIKFPYSMIGQTALETGSYMLFVSSSGANVTLEPTRTTRFNISSNAIGINSSIGLPLQLMTINSSDLLTFSSSAGGPFVFSASAVIISQSLGDTITELDLTGVNVGGIKYIWTLNGLTKVMANPLTATQIGGMPSTLLTMSIYNSSLSSLYPLNETSISVFQFSYSNLTSLPLLPPTMSYIDCSQNILLTSVPTLPSGSETLICNNCPLITNLPTIPITIKTLNAASCNLTVAAQNAVCSDIWNGGTGMNSGTLTLTGNIALTTDLANSASMAVNVANLRGAPRLWTITV